ncbi:MAG: hypothetical protein HRU04_24000 [Oceanospirillaceae bacterium]|nr:hypothetical protein [Oceanospirillaceae bacterium]
MQGFSFKGTINCQLKLINTTKKNNIKALGLWAFSHKDGSIYAEPGLFVINPEQKIQIMGTGNTASCRPDLHVLLDGIKGIQSRALPLMGTIE